MVVALMSFMSCPPQSGPSQGSSHLTIKCLHSPFILETPSTTFVFYPTPLAFLKSSDLLLWRLSQFRFAQLFPQEYCIMPDFLKTHPCLNLTALVDGVRMSDSFLKSRHQPAQHTQSQLGEHDSDRSFAAKADHSK